VVSSEAAVNVLASVGGKAKHVSPRTATASGSKPHQPIHQHKTKIEQNMCKATDHGGTLFASVRT